MTDSLDEESSCKGALSPEQQDDSSSSEAESQRLAEAETVLLSSTPNKRAKPQPQVGQLQPQLDPSAASRWLSMQPPDPNAEEDSEEEREEQRRFF